MATTKKKASIKGASSASSKALMKAQSAAVAVLEDSDYAALTREPREIAEIIESNVGPGGFNRFDLERVKIPTQGSTRWTLETVEGEHETEEIEGIILLKKATRVYFSQPFEETGGNTPPDCSSEDAYRGVGNPGGDCTTCKFNAFGTAAKGDGKACREIMVLFVLLPGKLLPLVITVTPGSLREVRKYFLRLAGEGYASYFVTTKFRLDKASNKRGIKYARVKATIGRPLLPDEIAAVRAYVDNIKPALQQTVQVSQVELEGEE